MSPLQVPDIIKVLYIFYLISIIFPVPRVSAAFDTVEIQSAGAIFRLPDNRVMPRRFRFIDQCLDKLSGEVIYREFHLPGLHKCVADRC